MIDPPALIQPAVESYDAIPADKRAAMAVQKLAESKQHFAKKHWAQYFDALFAAEKLDPDNREAVMTAVQANFALKRLAAAFSGLEKYLIRHPDDQEFWRNYAIAALNHDEYARVLCFTSPVLDRNDILPVSRELILVMRLDAHFKRGEFAQAELLALNPLLVRNRDAFMIRVNVLFERGDVDAALGALDCAISGNVNDVDLVLIKANYCCDTGRLDAAKSTLSFARITHPYDFRIRLRQLDLLNGVADVAQRNNEVMAYRHNFKAKSNAMLALMQYAVYNGDVALADELAADVDVGELSERNKYALLRIECRVVKGLYSDATAMIDSFQDADRARLNHDQMIAFTALRLVARLGCQITEATASERFRLGFDAVPLPMTVATACAPYLIKSGHKDIALFLVEKAYAGGPKKPDDFTSLLKVHLSAGGDATTPLRFAEAINQFRPNSVLLRQALTLLDGEPYSKLPSVQPLCNNIRTLLSGHPILPPVGNLR